MKIFHYSAVVTILATALSCNLYASPKEPYTQAGFDTRTAEKQQAPIHWVSVEQIKAS